MTIFNMKPKSNHFGPMQWSCGRDGVQMHKTWWRVTIDLNKASVMLIFDAITGKTALLNFENGSTIRDKDAIFSHPALTWTKWTGPSEINKSGESILVKQNGVTTKYTPQKMPNFTGADWRQLADPFCKYERKGYIITPLVYNYAIGRHVWYWEYAPWIELSLVPTFTIATWNCPVFYLP